MTQQSPYEDIDPTETQEWLESIESVMRAQGPQRAHFLLEKLVDFTRRSGAYLPFKPNTAYFNAPEPAREVPKVEFPAPANQPATSPANK